MALLLFGRHSVSKEDMKGETTGNGLPSQRGRYMLTSCGTAGTDALNVLWNVLHSTRREHVRYLAPLCHHLITAKRAAFTDYKSRPTKHVVAYLSM